MPTSLLGKNRPGSGRRSGLSPQVLAVGFPYVLRLERGDDGYDAVIFDALEERPVDRETGEQILTVLREFAS